MSEVKERKRFFFEKKNQKTFAAVTLCGLLCATPCLRAGELPGASIFNERCALCHQADGHGAPGVAPSLAGTLANYTKTPDGVRYLSQILVSGMVGRIPAEGHSFSGLMPSFAGDFSDAQIAATVDYVLATYNGVGTAPITAEDVAQARATNPIPTQTRHLREKILAASP